MLKIDKNVPLPPIQTIKYPFPFMEVGDSFFAPGKDSSFFGTYVTKYPGRKFTTRVVTEKLVKGVRIWRTA